MKAPQKHFCGNYYTANMIVLLSETVSRPEAQFLRCQRIAGFFSSKYICKTIICNQGGNLVAITDSIQAN